jgi:photosystem II stability/assembly factor-like uncharacterized protein
MPLRYFENKVSIMLVILLLCSSALSAQITFELQSAATQASLRGVCAVNEKTVWVSGAQATVLRSIDGGKTWQKKTVEGATGLDFRDIYALDTERAWVLSAGSPACIYYTADGGNTWRLQYKNTHPQAFLNAFAFWDGQYALAFGDVLEGEFLVLRTEDGGQNWQEVATGIKPLPQEGGFAASGTCLVVEGRNEAYYATGGAAQARLLRSTNQGRTWQVHNTPLEAGKSSAGIFSIYFYKNKGVAVGGDYLQANRSVENSAFSKDGGRTWQLSREPPNGYRSCVVYVPAARVHLTVGTNGTDVSYDEGDTWKFVNRHNLNSIHFARQKRVGWAVGARGLIYKVQL